MRAVAIALLLVASNVARAHELRPAYLELRQTGPESHDVLWRVPARGTLRLGLYVHLPDQCRELAPREAVVAGDAYVERWRVECPGGLAGRAITIDGLRSTMTDVLVRLEALDGASQMARILPSNPTLVVATDPGAWQVVTTYLRLGVEHILFGVDHLLFVLALLLLVHGWRRVVGTITAFTLAHTLTLAAATLGWVTIPTKPVEATIALSIVFVATEIVRGSQGHPGMTARWPWVVAFTFGLLHGFGFAGALHEIGLPQRSIPLALLCFNAGVELGQLTFVLGVVVLRSALRAVVPALVPERMERAAAYVIGTVAMYWVIERVSTF
ncbi:MAG TPA: HupE/UreJ family protein [Candidatus Binatia bacterium]|jgi:hypothetical protein|nr:HupE/UreJ family protein [Candidatus Binatia bacterium]